jgi:hypothetical protein
LRRLQLKQARPDHTQHGKCHGGAQKMAVVKCDSGLLRHNLPDW